MLTKRIAKQLNRRNWATGLIELLLIVLGVFIGLQVDNWNQSRIERETVKTYYDRLIVDLRFNEQGLQSRMDYYRQVQAHGEAVLESLGHLNEDMAEQIIVDAYQASQVWQIGVNRATYTEILSVGAMGTIPDLEARERLTNYYVAFDAMMPQILDQSAYRETLRTYLPLEIQRRMNSECGDQIVLGPNGAITDTLPDICELNLDKKYAVSTASMIIGAPDFALQLNRRLSDIDLRLSILGRNKQRSSDLADYLEQTRP